MGRSNHMPERTGKHRGPAPSARDVVRSASAIRGVAGRSAKRRRRKGGIVNRFVVMITILVAASLQARAACMRDGTTGQVVFLSVEGKRVDSWEPSGSDIRRVRLPAGFEVGVQIEPATKEKYRELFKRHPNMPAVDELAKITLYDMSTTPPKELSLTWGGVNSRQGFGPRGGANGVPQLIDQIDLHLSKPICVTRASLETQ